MLFIKCISDKYADYDGFETPVVIPKGAVFLDMAALEGNADIGNRINADVIQRTRAWRAATFRTSTSFRDNCGRYSRFRRRLIRQLDARLTGKWTLPHIGNQRKLILEALSEAVRPLVAYRNAWRLVTGAPWSD